MGRFDKEDNSDPTPVLKAEHCYAKSNGEGVGTVSLLAHCALAGRVGIELLKQCPSLFPKGSELVVAAHDVGKASPGFQKKICNATLKTLCPELAAVSLEGRGWESSHAVIGEAAFRDCYPAVAEWAKAIGAHHGSRKNPMSGTCGAYGGSSWAAERARLLEMLVGQFGEPPQASPSREQFKLVAGLTCVSDWIASNEELFSDPASAGDERILAALEDAGWRMPQIKDGLAFNEVFPFCPNSMQEEFIRCVDRRGVYVLEAPMGLGKTEAALFAAYKLMESGQNSGLYFGLPTRLTSDRIHQRVEEFMGNILENPGFVKLIHGHAWMNLESNVAEFKAGMGWFHPRKRALLAPFGVGTIDQALMSVLKVKHHFVRTFGLAGKVVILDEVHSYDAYTGTLLNCLVEELLEIGCSVIILSATLTAERRSDFLKTLDGSDAYPLISAAGRTVAPPPPPDRRIELSFHGDATDSLIEQAVLAAERGLCVLWIANTVANSQEVLRRINAERKEGDLKVGLLHSRFPAFRRGELEDDWIEVLGKDGDRPDGCILVATQVVEQSVDIDADLLITELAPTDMLLQRMGRLCRHDREDRPDGSGQAWIYGATEPEWVDAKPFKEALGASQYVYAPYVLWKTIQIWSGRSEINLPGDIRELLESTYAERRGLPEWVEELKADLDAKKTKLQGAALGLTKIFCGEDDEDSASTRYSTRPTISVLILQECDDCGTVANVVLCDGTPLELKAGERDFKSAVAVHQNMVSLPMPFGLNPRVPAWLKTTVFGCVWVLRIRGNDLVDLDGLDVPWGYHPDNGVYKQEVCECKPEWKLEDEDESYY